MIGEGAWCLDGPEGGQGRGNAGAVCDLSVKEPAASSVALPEGLALQIVERVRAAARPERIILFGSRARGDAEPRSDIDLAIGSGKMTPAEWLSILEALETVDTLLPIQAVRLEEAPAALLARIDREGVLLYADPEAGR